MATYNGEAFIQQQLISILNQLSENDEVIISDDGSTDSTIELIKSFKDNRIVLYSNHFHNHILNFEFVLSHASGDFIFLSDQDDVWVEDKVKVMMAYLERYDLVCSNCYIVDSNLNDMQKEFYTIPVKNRRGFFRNLHHNNYLGCCMGFRKNILEKALPFPKRLITHDTWIGMVAESCGTPIFIDDKLIYFRRHNSNTSNTLKGSNLTLLQKLSYRYVIMRGLCCNILLPKFL